MDMGRSNTKPDSPPQGGEKTASPARRMTFDYHAEKSFSENPQFYKKKIIELRREENRLLTAKMDEIEDKILSAAQQKRQKT